MEVSKPLTQLNSRLLEYTHFTGPCRMHRQGALFGHHAQRPRFHKGLHLEPSKQPFCLAKFTWLISPQSLSFAFAWTLRSTVTSVANSVYVGFSVSDDNFTYDKRCHRKACLAPSIVVVGRRGFCAGSVETAIWSYGRLHRRAFKNTRVHKYHRVGQKFEVCRYVIKQKGAPRLLSWTAVTQFLRLYRGIQKRRLFFSGVQNKIRHFYRPFRLGNGELISPKSAVLLIVEYVRQLSHPTDVLVHRGHYKNDSEPDAVRRNMLFCPAYITHSSNASDTPEENQPCFKTYSFRSNHTSPQLVQKTLKQNQEAAYSNSKTSNLAPTATDGSCIKTYGQHVLRVILGLHRKFMWFHVINDIARSLVPTLSHFNILVELRQQRHIDAHAMLSARGRPITLSSVYPVTVSGSVNGTSGQEGTVQRRSGIVAGVLSNWVWQCRAIIGLTCFSFWTAPSHFKWMLIQDKWSNWTSKYEQNEQTGSYTSSSQGSFEVPLRIAKSGLSRGREGKPVENSIPTESKREFDAKQYNVVKQKNRLSSVDQSGGQLRSDQL
ncbi:hypothetical protein CLF_112005 [Clonorchis sinensis]|uniref:Uncharacterized protein n=1 Tax=Clonorchis sinensis TaxID=79923 RepID=G7YVN7_CLOSI|nr:hypothetical protein CLF_112005 [Clonorchis sinensis]